MRILIVIKQEEATIPDKTLVASDGNYFLTSDGNYFVVQE